jgi:peptidoglycan/xylan/chitin deacetylase (PgdA/CDA1 family)
MPGPTVLFWHRVAHLPQDPHLLAVTAANFEEQLLALRRHYPVVSLAELAARLSRGRRPEPLVVLTFDDGYADNAKTVLPILKRHGLPATFYLAAGFVGTTREYLQDDLERLLLFPSRLPDELRLTIGGKSYVWSLNFPVTTGSMGSAIDTWNITRETDPTPRHRAHREIHGLLRLSPPAERERSLDQLRSQCGDPGTARATHSAMTWDDARVMGGCELAEVGAHTVNHPWLSSLSLAEQRWEIAESKRILEDKIGQPVASFAYPYGSHESYTMETVSLVKDVGFTNACTTSRERIGYRTNPFQLPRLVVQDWDGEEFLRRLRVGRL